MAREDKSGVCPFGCGVLVGAVVAVCVMAVVSAYLIAPTDYLRGQIDQASGVNTVHLVTQANGETKWEPTTKGAK